MRWLFGAWIVPALVLVTPADAQLGLNEGPLVRFVTREHFFGDLPQETRASTIFEFENGGTDTLRIENIESSCGCTAVAPENRAIAPGETSGIDVVFNSRDYKGEQSFVVAVYTNDPTDPRVDLVIHANVIPFVQISEDTLDFGDVETGTEVLLATLVTADAGTDFEILGFENDEAGQFVDWNVVPASAPNRIAYRVEARLRPDAPLGNFSERVVMQLRHPNRPAERIFLRGRVFSYFRTEEKRVNFHTVAKGRNVTRSVEIQGDATRAYRIEEVTVPAAYISANLVETGTGYRVDLTLDSARVDSDEPRFRFRDFAVLKTTDPRQPEIILELSGVVKK